MNGRIVTILLAVAVVLAASAVVPQIASLRLPGNHQSFEPVQPIAFSHRLHAGELEVPCLYCHSGAEKSRHAGIPASSTCLNCHRFITAPRSMIRAEEKLAEKEGRKPNRVVSDEIARIYASLGLGRDLQPAEGVRPAAVRWARVHQLPDFVYFDHSAHVAGAKIDCSACHGAVETMERVRQAERLDMGWCVNCHRGAEGTPGALLVARGSTDCATCHY